MRQSGIAHILQGGQYGSEGKGEFAAWMSWNKKIQTVVRIGGPNAGHTVTPNGMAGIKMQQLPTAWVNASSQALGSIGFRPELVLAKGALIAPQILDRELAMVERQCLAWGVEPPTVVIDPKAILVTELNRMNESGGMMQYRLGSTMTGSGDARRLQIMRHPHNQHFEDIWEGGQYWERIDATNRTVTTMDFHQYKFVKCEDTGELIRKSLDQSRDVLIESTQGFALSLMNSGNYPFVTSRDVTPGIILNDCGLSSRHPHRVYGLLRTYPIRVAGNSGGLYGELSWEEIQGFVPHVKEPERTTTTNRERRIGSFDWKLVQKFCEVCRPDALYVSFLDYLIPELHECDDPQKINDLAGGWLYSLYSNTGVTVDAVSTAPGIITAI